MKQIYSIFIVSLCVLLCLGVETASAETPNLYKEVDATSVIINHDYYSSSSSSSSEKLTGSFEFDYSFIEDYAAIGINLNLGGLVFFGQYQPIDVMPEGVSKIFSWAAGAALNKRIYLLNFFYVEGRVGGVYHNVSTTYEESDEAEDIGSWGAFAAPRVGLRLLDNICINLGYKWNFAEFKFTEEYTTEYMTAGISFLF